MIQLLQLPTGHFFTRKRKCCCLHVCLYRFPCPRVACPSIVVRATSFSYKIRGTPFDYSWRTLRESIGNTAEIAFRLEHLRQRNEWFYNERIWTKRILHTKLCSYSKLLFLGTKWGQKEKVCCDMEQLYGENWTLRTKVLCCELKCVEEEMEMAAALRS